MKCRAELSSKDGSFLPHFLLAREWERKGQKGIPSFLLILGLKDRDSSTINICWGKKQWNEMIWQSPHRGSQGIICIYACKSYFSWNSKAKFVSLLCFLFGCVLFLCFCFCCLEAFIFTTANGMLFVSWKMKGTPGVLTLSLSWETLTPVISLVCQCSFIQ